MAAEHDQVLERVAPGSVATGAGDGEYGNASCDLGVRHRPKQQGDDHSAYQGGDSVSHWKSV